MRYILVLLAGILVGAMLVWFTFVGAPRANKLPGNPVTAPDATGTPPGTAQVALDERFFNTVLATIFRDIGAPQFPLQLGANDSPLTQPFDDKTGGTARIIRTQATNQGAGGCQNSISILQEGSGVQSSVRFVDGKIMLPLAFQGSYQALGNCFNFKGWAQARIDLRFDQERQTLYGQVNVEGVNLDGANPFFVGIVTPLVQNAINQRVNPLEILRAQQLSLAVPVIASGGTLRAQVKDVRADIKDKLQLYITYDFNGQRGQQQQPQGGQTPQPQTTPQPSPPAPQT